MSTNIKFSIIVPVYNVERYLRECVSSVLKQTFTDFEMILVDDGSTDGSPALCDDWAMKDSRICVIHKTNEGASTARNIGLAKAIGDYVLFLDSDDYWLSEHVLKEIAERIVDTAPDVLVFNLCKVFEGRRNCDAYFSEAITFSTLPSIEDFFQNDLWTACPWNKAINRRMFGNDELRFVPDITAEDIDWCLRLAIKAERFDFVNINVVGYRQRLSSVSGAVTVQKMQCLLTNIETCVDLWEKADPDRRRYLKGYIGYQYGTLLYSLSSLPKSRQKNQLVDRAKKMAYLLEWSENPKIVLIRRTKKALGFAITSKLLSIKTRLDQIRNRRSA